MSNAAPKKVCQACGKDVTAEKRVRDSHNRYYCMPCNDAALKRARSSPTATAAAMPASSAPTPKPAAPADADDGAYDLAPAADVPSPPKNAVRPAAVTKARESGEGKAAAKAPALPKFCPNCEAPVLPNRRICIKCNRDLTRMDKLIAMKAEAAKGPSGADLGAAWIARGIKVFLLLALVGVVIFLALGIWTMFTPGGPFDEFPKTRAQAVTEFFTRVSKDQYDKAFYIVSFRQRTTNNENEIENYKRLYTRMHQEFNKRHGDNWIARLKVESIGDPNAPGEDALHLVKIDNATYHVLTQVQISIDQAIANRASRHQPTYPENGKNHFGVLEVVEYPIHPKDDDGPPIHFDRKDDQPE